MKLTILLSILLIVVIAHNEVYGHDYQHGCPDDIKCFEHCKKASKYYGRCHGPHRRHCICQDVAKPASYGCPDKEFECDFYCRKIGNTDGLCHGQKKEHCVCYKETLTTAP